MATSIISDQALDQDRNQSACSEFWNHELQEQAHQATNAPIQNRPVPECSPPPSLPPKPPHPPPVYRDPPRPPSGLMPLTSPPNAGAFSHQQPDICCSSPQKPIMTADCGSRSSIASLTQKFEKCEAGSSKQIFSGTEAWVQEQKSSGKMVGERLSSLQRKLRSLLTQSQTPVQKESKSTPNLATIEQNGTSQSEGAVNEIDTNQRIRNSVPIDTPSSINHNLSCIMPMSVGNRRSMGYEPPIPQSSSSYTPERHPFESNWSHNEPEDPTHLRDTCNKLFSREQKGAWSNYMSPRNFYSNNMKSPYDYDKVATKEVIGKPCQIKKMPEPASMPYFSEPSTSFPNLVVSPSLHHEPPQASETHIQVHQEPRHHPPKEVCCAPDTNQESGNSLKKNRGNPHKKSHRNGHKHSSDNCTADGGDGSDQYKSSSESGRGTMLSSLRDSKSVVSAHSSGAASYLDTSLDSDHSATGGLWDNHKQRDWSTQSAPGSKRQEDTNENNIQFSFGMMECEHSEKSMHNNAKNADRASYSGSLSVTPPLPPLSPPPSSLVSANSSPHGSPKAKYKLSLSTSALNSHSGKSTEMQQNMPECSKHMSSPATSRGNQSKKSGVRRTTSSSQNACQHWSSKSKNYSSRTSGTNSAHRSVYNHNGCSSSGRKSHGSPTSKQTSRSALVLPSYHELLDGDVTSTTTGIDGESVIDDPDDCSSDMSMTASIMDPLEMTMIRNQLEGLETMYSEILHLLGVKNGTCRGIPLPGGSTIDLPRHSRCKTTGSLSSLTAHSSNSRGALNYLDKRGFSEKRRPKDTRNGPSGKRLQLLESHVVTLARSVAHLSSELRTQHMLVQELEHMRRDVTWVHERLRLMQLSQGCPGVPMPQHDSRGQQFMPLPKDWAVFRKEVTELLNPSRAKKLTKFFGDEPPLIRQFLNRLGYEKYASNFESEKIGIMELPYLTEERLQKIGVPMGPRIRIIQEARSYSQQNQYKVYIV